MVTGVQTCALPISATHAGRVISTAPVTVFLADGKATVSDVEPGEMTVLLQCRGVESQGPVTVGVPDGKGTVTLRALLESQFEYAPPIVSAVQEAASNASASEEAAIRAQVRSEAAADRADAKVDDAINNGANLVRDEVKQDADRAVSARQAATQSETKAKASEGAAASSASSSAASESAAKQSETNAGDFAAVATTAATEAVDAMESANTAVSSIGDSVSEAAGHADRAGQHESGAAAYAQNASDAADRVGTAEQVGTWAQQAQDAADRIGTAEQVGVWADESSAAASLASTSASKAKVSETNSAMHEANSLSAAERAEFAAEETIQQVEGDFATRNYVDQKVASVALTGTGSPEGKVAAPVGSAYTDTAATNGAIRWIKTSGTGNTGWRVEYGDTGVRTLSRPEIFTGGIFRVSRTGDYVQLVIHAATLASGLPAWQSFMTLPPGFRTANAFRAQAQDAYLDVIADGRLAQISTNVPAGKIVSLGVVYRTNDSWPTSLPGTPG